MWAQASTLSGCGWRWSRPGHGRHGWGFSLVFQLAMTGFLVAAHIHAIGMAYPSSAAWASLVSALNSAHGQAIHIGAHEDRVDDRPNGQECRVNDPRRHFLGFLICQREGQCKSECVYDRENDDDVHMVGRIWLSRRKRRTNTCSSHVAEILAVRDA